MNHRLLINICETDFPDGWAALSPVGFLQPVGGRSTQNGSPFHILSGVRPAYAWEPPLPGGRNRTTNRHRARTGGDAAYQGNAGHVERAVPTGSVSVSTVERQARREIDLFPDRPRSVTRGDATRKGCRSMRGRKPKPTSQRRLDGNPGRRPFNAFEPVYPGLDASFDEPPSELDGNDRARGEWRRYAPILRRARAVTEADRAALVALCLEWSRYIEATIQVATTGLVVRAPSGYPMTNPYLSIATRALSSCAKLWPELGLTPSSRARVSSSGNPEADPFAEFDLPPAFPTAQRN